MLCTFLNYSFFVFFSVSLFFYLFNIFLNFDSHVFNAKLSFNYIIIVLIYTLIFIFFNLYKMYTTSFAVNIVLIYNLNYFYYFPFLFIFVLITLISIIFCLNYNNSELSLFLVYVSFIVFSGFNLFITNSILMFFLFYEFLLIPSFFILYIFSKTRRSVEAAYLMFFWTQFGALWLIFGLLYIYTLTGTLKFTSLSVLNLSLFDNYFLFICFLFGFGVKLPI